MSSQSGNQQELRASPVDIQKSLKGMKYPAGKESVVEHAREHKAAENVLAVLERLPDEEWKTPADLMKAVGKVE